MRLEMAALGTSRNDDSRIDHLDRNDPLGPIRERFALPEGTIYLDGNSLGALERTVPERLRTTIAEEWGRGLIGSWVGAGWIDLPKRVGAKIAGLVGAEPDEVIVGDSTSVNLFKATLAAAGLDPNRRTVLSERGEFPTDTYMAAGAASIGGTLRHRLCDEGGLAAALDGDTAVAVLSHVHYRSGEARDMASLGARARAAGAPIVWDLSHSAGAIRVDLGAAGADFAVGCGYKYLGGGPGAPAFLYVARRHQGGVRSPLPGWLGHAEPFAFDDAYRPARGIARFVCGTPGILGLVALDAALDALAGVDMAAVERKGRALGQLFIELVEDRCGRFGLSLASPRDPGRRGCHVALRHGHGYPVMRALIERGVIGDFRDPDILRFGFAPLYTRYRDVADAVEILRDVLASGAWREPRFAVRASVT
jgi:kynureninase